MDIGLHMAATGIHNLSEEECYCFMWCYILDRNYAWKLGRLTVLTVDPNTRVDLPPLNITPSALFLTYLDLAKVQDTMIPFLIDSTKGRDVYRLFVDVGSQLLQTMDRIRRNINQVGISTLYNMTTIQGTGLIIVDSR